MEISAISQRLSSNLSGPVPAQLHAQSQGPVEGNAQVVDSNVKGLPKADSAEAVIESLNQTVQAHSTALEFAVDPSTHTQVVVVKDSDTGDVLMQFPSEAALRMVRNLAAGIGGLVDTKV